MKEKIIKLLKDARALLVDKGWTQRTYARDETGKMVDYRSGTASSYCIEGACFSATPSDASATNLQARNALVNCISYSHIPMWNDDPNRTLDDVLQAFDRAIERVEKS